ncbi:MAG: Hpt domain-containing protein [Thermoleophilia bacterium]
MQEYLGLFLDESRENLQALNASILDLERAPDDPEEALNTIFRVAHSLKGMSATMGFERMAGLTHRMEEVLSQLRDGGAPVTTEITDVLFACLDTLEGMVNDIGDGGSGAADTGALMDRLIAIVSGEPVAMAQAAATMAPPAPPAAPPVAEDEVRGVLEQIQTGDTLHLELSDYERVVLAEAAERGMPVKCVKVRLEDACMLRAARAYMVVQEIEALGELIKAEPSTEDLEREAFEFEFTLWVATDQPVEVITAAVSSVSEVAECTTAVIAVDGAPAAEEPAAPAAPEAPAAVEPAAPAPSRPRGPGGRGGGARRGARTRHGRFAGSGAGRLPG